MTRYFDFRNAGIGRVSSEIANRLEQRGHEVKRISTNTWSLYQYFRYTTFELPFKIPRGYDVYHALTPLEAIWIPKHKGVVTFYDFIPILYPEKAGTGLHSSWILKHGSRIYFWLATQFAANCHQLTCISEETRKDLCRVAHIHDKYKDRITVVRLGIRPDLEPKPKPDNTFRVGYLGQLDRRKRVGLLVEAFHKSKIDGELAIGGVGPEKWRLEALAENDKRIKFLGLVPDDKIVDFYNSLDIFVFPTMVEGYSLPTVESMACMKPAIVLKDAIIPNCVKSRCIQLDELTPKVIDNLPWLVENMESNSGWQDKRQSNYAFAKIHDWEKCVDQYEQLYRNIVEGKG